MLDRSRQRRRCMASRLMAVVCILLGLGVLAADGFPAPLVHLAPSRPPRNYLQINSCAGGLGQVWASPSESSPAGGIMPPMLGFYQNTLTGMIFYLSEKHLYPLLPHGGRWSFTSAVNAPVDSITLRPAQHRPHREKRAYELIVMLHHDPPIAVTCASNTPTTSQNNVGGANKSGGFGSGTDGAVDSPGAATKHPKK